VLDLLAGGIRVRDIAAHVRGLRGVDVGRDTISRVTDAVVDDLRRVALAAAGARLSDRLPQRAHRGPRGQGCPVPALRHARPAHGRHLRAHARRRLNASLRASRSAPRSTTACARPASRRCRTMFVSRTRDYLTELMSRPLDDLRLAVPMLDWIELKGRCRVVATGIDTARASSTRGTARPRTPRSRRRCSRTCSAAVSMSTGRAGSDRRRQGDPQGRPRRPRPRHTGAAVRAPQGAKRAPPTSPSDRPLVRRRLRQGWVLDDYDGPGTGYACSPANWSARIPARPHRSTTALEERLT
jgi:hypothetical protein